jgi:hypothetical protein
MPGGAGGTPFSFPDTTSADTRISSITVASGMYEGTTKVVGSLKVCYGPSFSFQQGRDQYDARTVNLGPHDYITGVIVRTGNVVDSIQFQVFVYNKSGSLIRVDKHGPFGGSGGGNQPNLVTAGSFVVGFSGRAGLQIDNLEVKTAPLPV